MSEQPVAASCDSTPQAPTAEPRVATACQSRRLVASGLLVAAAAIAFGWPTLHGDFLAGDDHRLVADHYLVNHPSVPHAWELLTRVHDDLYQPLPMLSFQANYALAAARPGVNPPVDPTGFHAVNIALHALNSVLVLLLASRLAGCRRIGLLTGLMFACHPFSLETVAWINGRMILLASMFALVVLISATRDDNRPRIRWMVGILLAWGASLLSKVLPTVPLAAAWCDFHTRGRVGFRRGLTYAIALLMGAAAAWFALRSTHSLAPPGAMAAEDVASLPVRLLLATRYYLENYAWPAGLAPWSPPPAEDVTMGSPAVLLAFVEVTFLFGALILTRRHNRTAFLGLGLFVILLAPFLATLESRRMLAADRYMYLPILGLHLAVAAWAVRAADSLRAVGRLWMGRALLVSGAGLMLAVWTLLAWQLAGGYASTIRRDSRVVEVHPDSPDARAELAGAFLYARDADAALAILGKARERWPEHPRLASRAGEAYVQRKDWSSAIIELEPAVRTMPRHTPTRYLLAFALEQAGRADEARTQYSELLAQDEDFVPAMLGLARISSSAGQFDDAIRQYLAALRINPHHHESLSALANTYMRLGNFAGALPILERMRADDPLDAGAMLSLGIARAKTSDLNGALAIYNELLEQQPKALAPRLNRAEVLKTLQRWSEAEADYQAILRDQPDQPDAKAGLAELHRLRGTVKH